MTAQVSETVIRTATWADVAAIAEIYNESVLTSTANWDHEPRPLERFMAWFADHEAAGLPVLVASDDDRVVGWASLSLFKPTMVGYLTSVEHSVYVRPDAQGRGVGTALLTRVIAAARSAGKHSLIGALSGDNEASLAFHRRHGFVEVARMPEMGRKFGRWLDLVYVQLLLDDADVPRGTSRA